MNKPTERLVQTIDAEVCGDFTDPVAVWHGFLESLNHLPGVTVLATCKHEFPGGGLSGLVIIGESHAAIHTWPELGRAWVELATCGDPAALTLFAARWRACAPWRRSGEPYRRSDEPYQRPYRQWPALDL